MQEWAGCLERLRRQASPYFTYKRSCWPTARIIRPITALIEGDFRQFLKLDKPSRSIHRLDPLRVPLQRNAHSSHSRCQSLRNRSTSMRRFTDWDRARSASWTFSRNSTPYNGLGEGKEEGKLGGRVDAYCSYPFWILAYYRRRMNHSVDFAFCQLQIPSHLLGLGVLRRYRRRAQGHRGREDSRPVLSEKLCRCIVAGPHLVK